MYKIICNRYAVIACIQIFEMIHIKSRLDLPVCLTPLYLTLSSSHSPPLLPLPFDLAIHMHSPHTHPHPHAHTFLHTCLHSLTHSPTHPPPYIVRFNPEWAVCGTYTMRCLSIHIFLDGYNDSWNAPPYNLMYVPLSFYTSYVCTLKLGGFQFSSEWKLYTRTECRLCGTAFMRHTQRN